jgi:hypothetical protein
MGSKDPHPLLSIFITLGNNDIKPGWFSLVGEEKI